VTREVTRRVVVAATTAAFATLAGCSGTAAGSAQPNTQPGTRSSSSDPSVTLSPREHSSASATPGVPTPGSLDRPATSSGPLSKRSFPTPKQLGAGWRYAVDPGDAEEGYAGNGTPSLARSPQEIVQTAVPFGCARHAPMPAPTHALEVDYTFHGAKVIAVRSSFASPARSREFFTGRAHNLEDCAGHSSGAAIGTLVSHLTRPARDALANDRTPTSDPWREVAVLDDDVVALVAVQGDNALTSAETRRLVRLLRS
jgi:hypothetical protein